MTYLLSISVFLNLFLAALFFRSRHLNKKIYKDERLVLEYLRLHDQLQKTSGAVVEIKKLDSSNMMYWEPTR